jgi:3-hydroxyisobutyrate dehydrogenase-like beta-hydroxyacid dehydrogenase
MNAPDSPAPTVAVLHPGQMGAAVTAELHRRGVEVLWCPTGRSERTSTRARQAGLRSVDDLAELLDRADVVLSICPPSFAEEVAAAVVEHRFTGVYVDANAISPGRMRRLHLRLEAAGARVIDGALIGPPPGDTATTRLYLSGDADASATVAQMFTHTSVEPVYVNAEIGSASGLKMAYASYQKATRALAGVAHALAADLDVTEHLIAEANRNSRSPLADPDYLPSVAARAWRWAPEMREIADALTAARLPPEQAYAAAAVLERWNGDKDQDVSVSDALAHLRIEPA